MKSRSPFDNYFLRGRETTGRKYPIRVHGIRFSISVNRFIEAATTSRTRRTLERLFHRKFVRGVCVNSMTIKLDFRTNDNVSAYTYIHIYLQLV